MHFPTLPSLPNKNDFEEEKKLDLENLNEKEENEKKKNFQEEMLEKEIQINEIEKT